jgi:hypothetical protein
MPEKLRAAVAEASLPNRRAFRADKHHRRVFQAPFWQPLRSAITSPRGRSGFRFLVGFDKERDLSDIGASAHARYSGRFTAAIGAIGSISAGIGILRAILNRSQK